MKSAFGYKGSALFISVIVLLGFVLQINTGSFNFYFLLYPVNIILAGILVMFIGIGMMFKKTVFIKWITGIPFSICLIVGILLFSLIMGLVPQTTSPQIDTTTDNLGLTNVTSSWPFVLLYTCALFSLGVITLKRVASFKRGSIKKNLTFLMNHFGLWVILAAAGFGVSDMQRHIMYVYEGETEWKVYNENNEVLELPIAIHLHDFDMDVYPPKLALIDLETGEPLPKKKPFWVEITSGKTRTVEGWQITPVEYIHNAVPSESGYREISIPGASPAVLVKAVNPGIVDVKEDWVVASNPIHPIKPLFLDDKHAIVVTQPEPKHFISKITVYTENGLEEGAVLEVNKPFTIDGWKIYQYGYDVKAGRLSGYSSFELVYDPWLNLFYFGTVILIIGSFGMIWFGRVGT